MSPHLTFCNLTNERDYPLLLELNHSSRQANNVPAPITIEVIANVLANINHRTIGVRRGCFFWAVVVIDYNILVLANTVRSLIGPSFGAQGMPAAARTPR